MTSHNIYFYKEITVNLQWLEHSWLVYHPIIQKTLFITAFVITAKFVIRSIRSARKSTNRVFFLRHSHVILWEDIRFGYLLESPRRGDSDKYAKG